MLWVIYSLLCALSLATADAISKKSLERADEYTISWIRFLFSIPYLLTSFVFIRIPEIDRTFWLSIFILLPLEISATVLYIKALKVSPLSLTIPFLSFTPLFLILTSFIILGEKPSLAGVIGIILIVLGAYALNINSMNSSLRGLFEPLRVILKEKGSIYMIIVAFIYSITSSLGKVAIIHSSPVFFGVIYYIILAIAFTPLVLLKSQSVFRFRNNALNYGLIGFFIALMLVFHVSAIALTDVAYMISIKRTSLLFSVIYGRLIFREGGFKQRILGSIMMVIGVGIISILG